MPFKTLLEKNFFSKKKYSEFYFLFITSILSNPLMNHTKTNNFFLRRINIKDKNVFSPIYSFSFLSSVLFFLTDNKVAQKTVHGKSFSEKLVFWKKNILITFILPRYPIDISYQKFQKKIHFWKLFSVRKNPKIIFFLSSDFCTPTDNNVLQKIFSWKELSIGIFFCNIVYNYSHQPCVPHW